MNSFSLDESSAPPLISVAAEVGGVDRLGVVGREDGFEPCGVVVAEGSSDDGAAKAMLTGCSTGAHAAAVLAVRDVAGSCSAGIQQQEICSCCGTTSNRDSVGDAKHWGWSLSRIMISNPDQPLRQCKI